MSTEIRPNPDATHQPILARCLLRTSGPVLELGAGFSSTLLLSALCKQLGRELITHEMDAEWADRFRYLGHQINTFDYGNAIIERSWGLVFVDHAPAEIRVREIERLRHYADIIVAHDTQPEEEENYHYGTIIPTFPYRYTDSRYRQHTTAISMKINLDFLQ